MGGACRSAGGRLRGSCGACAIGSAAVGQLRLGKTLLDGSHGMSQHVEHGTGWVRAAAEEGRTDAVIEVGSCDHSRRRVPQSLSLAKEFDVRGRKARQLGSSAGSA
ncbi:hypothetical protein FVE85_6963 [Porphyridium purpureum]|uniref:Uncharacterized protein n=1 Tax=Porphyridium purpureum TaxID=35688 RepID=A0A5J4Z8B0_PORPP|nr:hypothetical protein FVE85_6963 [Porphyridium purpureum]|eukprot:POR4342..scf295_1